MPFENGGDIRALRTFLTDPRDEQARLSERGAQVAIECPSLDGRPRIALIVLKRISQN
jgi:hypothetical protein